ncbi:MAG: hypothetical protein HY296_00455 [Thaumarchaeota archaeon]|nr:hypothetical protein [Nitrososphaerota archaeon]
MLQIEAGTIVSSFLDFLKVYVEPYAVSILILGAVIWVGAKVSGARRFASAKAALRDEIG